MTFNKPLPEIVVSHNLNGSFGPVKSILFICFFCNGDTVASAWQHNLFFLADARREDGKTGED